MVAYGRVSCCFRNSNLVERQPQPVASDLVGSADNDRDLDSVKRQHQAIYFGQRARLVMPCTAHNALASGRDYGIRASQIRSPVSFTLPCGWIVLGDSRLRYDVALYWRPVLGSIPPGSIRFSAPVLAEALWPVAQPVARTLGLLAGRIDTHIPRNSVLESSPATQLGPISAGSYWHASFDTLFLLCLVGWWRVRSLTNAGSGAMVRALGDPRCQCICRRSRLEFRSSLADYIHSCVHLGDQYRY